jgi:hypothetical protein
VTISLNASARKQDHDTKRSLPDQDISDLFKTDRNNTPYNIIVFSVATMKVKAIIIAMSPIYLASVGGCLK